MNWFLRFSKRNKNKFKYSFSFLSVILLSFVLYKFYKMGILTNEKALSDFLGDWYFIAPIIFISIRLLVSFVPFLPNMFLIIVGFSVFGTIKGAIYNYISSVLAALADFFLVKIFGYKVLKTTFSEDKMKKYKKQINQSQKRFNRFLFITNSIPLAPSNFFCMIAALTSLPIKRFINIILVSKFPETLIIGLVLKYFESLLRSFL